MTPNLISVQAPDFEGSASPDGDAYQLALVGTADYAAIEALDRVLDELHAAVLAGGVRSVRVDMRQLEFMNSSCFKSLLRWVGNIQALEPAQQYTLQFVSNPELHWQKRSLESLRCFAVDLITVTRDAQPDPR